MRRGAPPRGRRGTQVGLEKGRRGRSPPPQTRKTKLIVMKHHKVTSKTSHNEIDFYSNLKIITQKWWLWPIKD